MVVTSYPVGIRPHNLTNLETLIIAVVSIQLFQNKGTFYLFHVSVHIREIRNLNKYYAQMVCVCSFLYPLSELLVSNILRHVSWKLS